MVETRVHLHSNSPIPNLNLCDPKASASPTGATWHSGWRPRHRMRKGGAAKLPARVTAIQLPLSETRQPQCLFLSASTAYRCSKGR